MTRAVRHVVVAGSDASTWLTAAAVLRAMRHRQIQVTVVDLGAPAAPAGYWTLPSQRGIHALLGLGENDLIRRTGATFKLGSDHHGWRGEGSRFLHVHGDIGSELSGTPFFKYLQLEALKGKAEDPAQYSVAALAARAAKFARPMGDDKSLTAAFTYGLHLRESAYREHVREHALALGVKRVAGAIADVVMAEDGSITALRLTTGETVAGDLFLDCSGADAVIAARFGNERDDWSSWLPCDRQLSGLAAAVEDPPAVTRTQAETAGWSWWAPLADASMVGLVYSSAFLSDEQAAELLGARLPTLREPRLQRFNSGRRTRPWQSNCIAIGAAAIELEPLVGAELHLAQLGFGNLIELFPFDTRCGIEAAEYNRVLAEHADALRDFTMAHYRVGAARTGDFWSATRAAPPPDRLRHKLDIYAASGRMNLLDFETFEEMDWAWLMLGNGVTPDELEAQIHMELAKNPPGHAASLREFVARLAVSMPRHIDYVRYQAQATAQPQSQPARRN
jgi:tryptophan halogenase